MPENMSTFVPPRPSMYAGLGPISHTDVSDTDLIQRFLLKHADAIVRP